MIFNLSGMLQGFQLFYGEQSIRTLELFIFPVEKSELLPERYRYIATSVLTNNEEDASFVFIQLSMYCNIKEDTRT